MRKDLFNLESKKLRLIESAAFFSYNESWVYDDDFIQASRRWGSCLLANLYGGNMDFFPGADVLLQKLLTHIIDQYPGTVAVGGYVLAVMAIGTVVLTLAIMYLSIAIPARFVKKIYKDLNQ